MKLGLVGALLLAVLSSALLRPRTNDRTLGRYRASQRISAKANNEFEFAPASKRGLSIPGPNLCDQLTPAEKTGEYWCINGSAVDPANTVAMVKQATAFEEINVKQCSGALNCYDVLGLRSTQPQSLGGGPFFKSAILSGKNTTVSTPYTACAWVRQAVSGGMYMSLGDEAEAGSRRYMLGLIAPATATDFTSSAVAGACGSGIVQTGSFETLPTVDPNILDEGSLILLCHRYDGINASLRHSFGDTAGISIGAHCAGGANARHLYGGLATVSVDGEFLTDNTTLYGGFYVSTALSSERIQEITSAMMANSIQSENGIYMTNARSTQMSCLSENGQQMTMLSPGQSCMTSGGVYKRREGRNYWADGARIGVGYGYSFVNAVRTSNTHLSPDLIKEAETVFFDAGADSRITKTTTTDTCPSGAAVLSYFVKGITMDGGIRAGYDDNVASFPTTCTDACSYNTTQWTRCKHSLPNVPATNKVSIGQFSSGAGCPATGVTNVANNVLIWGIQCEPDFGGGLATAYIPAPRNTSYKTHTADKPTFTVAESYTSPISMSAKWIAPPVSISLGDITGNTGSPPYLLALDKDGAARNSLAYKWQTGEYSSGTTSPIVLALELTAETGEIKFKGTNTDAGTSTVSLGADTVGPFLGGGSTQTYNHVNLGWSGTNLNFEGVITEVCIKADGC